MDTKLKTQIKIRYVDIDVLQPAVYNPRKWDESAIKNLSQSIKEFDLIDPLIVNKAKGRENIVIGGHFRLEIAKRLGYKQVTVVYVDIPDIIKEKELNLRLNRNTGAWDFELLKEFNISLLLDIEFDDSDLFHIWDDALTIEDDNFDVDKAIEEFKTPKTKLGNLIKLGNNFLICGDATDSETIMRLVENTKIHIINYDPPYNIHLDYDKGIGGNNGKYGGKQTDDNKTDEEYRKFLFTTLQNGLNVTQSDCHVFCWCDETYIGLLQGIYQELGIENKRVCLWIKNNQNATPQIAFNKAYEPCVYGTALSCSYSG